MTINCLQQTLIKDIEKTLEHLSLFDVEHRQKQIKAYPQALPIFDTRLGWENGENGEDRSMEQCNPEDKIFPYSVVRMESAKYQEEQGQASVYLMFGIYNDNRNMAGYFDLLNVIETIINRYRTNRVIGAYYCESKMNVAIQEDDTYPYFFGGIEMIWNLPPLQMEGELYD